MTNTPDATTAFTAKTTTVAALARLLRPIAKVLIRSGFSFRDFNEVAKLIFVEEATNEYGIRGRPTNISRVALMTGLTRREVTRLRKVNALDELRERPTILSRIYANWPRKTRSEGEPGYLEPIPMEGENSLCQLIDDLKCDIPRTVVIKELLRNGHVCELAGKAYLPERHACAKQHCSPVKTLADSVSFVSEAALRPKRPVDVPEFTISGPVDHFEINPQASVDFRNFIQTKIKCLRIDAERWARSHPPLPGHDETITVNVGTYAMATVSEKHLTEAPAPDPRLGQFPIKLTSDTVADQNANRLETPSASKVSSR